jgi:hypothetical protein
MLALLKDALLEYWCYLRKTHFDGKSINEILVKSLVLNLQDIELKNLVMHWSHPHNEVLSMISHDNFNSYISACDLWYVSNVSIFPGPFALVLAYNLHDLNGTNPGLTLFSAELPWCCFCAEIKVLGMTRNFRRIFYWINKKYWSQDPPKGGSWWANTHQAAPPPWRGLGGVPQMVGPLDLIPTPYNLFWGEKNRGEEFIAFHDTEPPPPPVLPREAWSGVRLGLRRGGSSSFVIINLSPVPIPWCSPPGVSNSLVGLLVGERVGWDSSCNQVSFGRAWSLVSTMFWDWCCYDLHVLNACH